MATIGNHITILDSIDSTNNYAMQKINEGLAEDGNVWLAMEQTAGKGQRGKKWDSIYGENILLSIALQTNLINVHHQFRLSATIATACRFFIQKLIKSPVYIKWPNDLYINDNKTGGILIQNIIQGHKWKWAVVGIGININQTDFPPDIYNATSLKLTEKKDFNILDLSSNLLETINNYWQRLICNQWKNIFEEYNHFLYKRDKQVYLKKENTITCCTIEKVNEQGMLQIKENKKVYFNIGEVVWINRDH